MFRRAIFTVLACTTGALSMLTTGCEDPFIDPFVSGRHYTVYGFLAPFDDEHFVRVVAVRRTPEEIPTPTSPHAELDGDVTSTDLTTGETHRWLHTLAALDDGTFGHVFRASFVVRVGHRYQLVITRSDGAQSTAETTVPSFDDWTALPAVISGDSAFQTIAWAGLTSPEEFLVSYCAKPVGGFACSPVVVPYGRQGRRSENGWEIDVRLTRDLLFVRQQLGVSESVTLELASTDMTLKALDKSWLLPDEPIDPEQFAQPDALTNVENGFGYWGSLGKSVASWTPDTEALALSGYVPPGP